MCTVCVEWQKGKLTMPEAKAALNELFWTSDMDLAHYKEVTELIEETEK